MIEKKLHDIAEKNNLIFESLLAGYIREEMMKTICKTGFSSCLCLRNPNAFLMESYKGRACRELKFYYVEDERILDSDGFVPGCPFTKDYPEKFVSEVLSTSESFQMKNLEIVDNGAYFDVYCENMYVPFYLEIQENRGGAFSLNQRDLLLPILGEAFEVLTYPIEQEVAEHLGVLLKDMELINEMEHYLCLYDICTREALEGVRLQTALTEMLKEKNLSFFEDRMETILSYKSYSYMKKKWKVLLRRQKRDTPDWEEVIDLLDRVFLPLWNAGREDFIFFGDWMPEIGRYLD